MTEKKSFGDWLANDASLPVFVTFVLSVIVLGITAIIVIGYLTHGLGLVAVPFFFLWLAWHQYQRSVK